MTDNPFDIFDDEERPAPVTAPMPSAGANPFDAFDAEEEAAASRAEAPSRGVQAPSATPQPLPAVPGMGFVDDDPALNEALAKLDAQNKRAGTDGLNEARGKSFLMQVLQAEAEVARLLLPGATYNQHQAELVKGIPPGAVSSVGTALQGTAAVKASGEFNAASFGRGQIDIFDRIDRGEAVAEMDDPTGYRWMTPEQRQAVRADVEHAAGYTPTPLDEQGLYKAGESVKAFAKTILPAAPGYEQAITRQLGEGMGSMAVGIPVALVGGGATAGLLYGAMGSGEAAERAIEYDRKERAAGRPGLTQDQINKAALWGVAPGTTDLLPVETLLGRLKIPQPFARFGARAIGRIGGQAFVEGMQEGGQSYLQNLIAREIYAPEQALAEGILPSAGIGTSVGASIWVPTHGARRIPLGGKRDRP